MLKSENQIAKDPRGDNQRWLDRREKFPSVVESWGRSSSGALKLKNKETIIIQQ